MNNSNITLNDKDIFTSTEVDMGTIGVWIPILEGTDNDDAIKAEQLKQQILVNQRIVERLKNYYVLNRHTIKGMFDTNQTKNLLVIETDDPEELQSILKESQS